MTRSEITFAATFRSEASLPARFKGKAKPIMGEKAGPDAVNVTFRDAKPRRNPVSQSGDPSPLHFCPICRDNDKYVTFP